MTEVMACWDLPEQAKEKIMKEEIGCTVVLSMEESAAISELLMTRTPFLWREQMLGFCEARAEYANRFLSFHPNFGAHELAVHIRKHLAMPPILDHVAKSIDINAFKADLITICRRHNLCLTTSGYDHLQIWPLLDERDLESIARAIDKATSSAA